MTDSLESHQKRKKGKRKVIFCAMLLLLFEAALRFIYTLSISSKRL